MTQWALPVSHVHLAYHLEINRYRQQKKLQCIAVEALPLTSRAAQEIVTSGVQLLGENAELM